MASALKESLLFAIAAGLFISQCSLEIDAVKSSWGGSEAVGGSEMRSEEPGHDDIERTSQSRSEDFEQAFNDPVWIVSRKLLQQIGSGITEAVDNRAAVSDSTLFPYNTIGRIAIQRQNSTSGCTGALIASKYVLTAAHCIRKVTTGEEIKTAQFTPGYNTAQKVAAPYGSSNVLSWRFPTAFFNCPVGSYTSCHQDNDFGILKLDRAFSSWMAYGYIESNTRDTIINTAGYPADKDDCSVAGGVCVPYHVSCEEGDIVNGAKKVNITCYTFSGQSGSPVWLYYKTNNTRLVRGVLTSDLNSYGRFTLITKDVFSFLQTYVGNF